MIASFESARVGTDEEGAPALSQGRWPGPGRRQFTRGWAMPQEGYRPVDARLLFISEPRRSALDAELKQLPRRTWLTAVDLEELLVRRGWHSLRWHIGPKWLRILVCTNNCSHHPRQRLRPGDYRVLRLLVHGTSHKCIAHELALSPATVRAAVRRVSHKLGANNGAQLPTLWRALRGPARQYQFKNGQTVLFFRCELLPSAALGLLTAAEIEVSSALLAGKSNRTVARERNTSERTIANQVAAVFRKLGVRSRAELGATILVMSGNEERSTANE